MVDTVDLKSIALTGVPVRIRPEVPDLFFVKLDDALPIGRL